MTKVDLSRRAEIDAELGPIEIDPAEVQGAAEPFCYERTLVMIEDARRDSVAAGITTAPELTLDRVERAKALLLGVVSKGRKRKDELAPQAWSDPAWAPEPDADLDVDAPVSADDSVDLGAEIDDLFGGIIGEVEVEVPGIQDAVSTDVDSTQNPTDLDFLDQS